MDETLNLTRNRRLTPRRVAKRGTRATCQTGALGLGKNLAVSLLDLSENGIRLMVRENLELGQEITVELTALCTQRRPWQIRAHVVWAVATADGGFCIGAEFDKRLEYRSFFELVPV